jgi:hypothetical protein
VAVAIHVQTLKVSQAVVMVVMAVKALFIPMRQLRDMKTTMATSRRQLLSVAREC